MRYHGRINYVKCQEWGINQTQGALFDLINEASSWAKPHIIDGEVYYWVSRNKVLDELPVVFKRSDTVYRNLKVLVEKSLIIYIKEGVKDLVQLTEKGRGWNAKINTEKNPSVTGLAKDADINPSKHGYKSENKRENTDINPTDKDTSHKDTIISKDKEKPATKKKEKFVPLKPDGVSEQTWDDLLTLRKTKRAVESQTAWNSIFNALEKTQQATGHSLEQMIIEWVTADWKGFRFDWYMNRTKASNQLTVNNQGYNHGQQPQQQSRYDNHKQSLEQQIRQQFESEDAQEAAYNPSCRDVY